MSTKVAHIKTFIYAFLFLGIMGGIIFNATFFIHVHRAECGQLIVHSHPFNKSSEAENPKTQHQHNKIELQVIQSLDCFVFDEIKANTLNPGHFLTAKYNIPTCFIKPFHLNNLKNYRAPPYFPV